MPDEWLEELARRLAAAFISWKLDYSGVDRTLRQYRERPIGESWVDLARALVKADQNALR